MLERDEKDAYCHTDASTQAQASTSKNKVGHSLQTVLLFSTQIYSKQSTW